MPHFAFVVEGPPVSVNAKDKQTRKYQNWIRTVREAARQEWPDSTLLAKDIDVEVRIVNYHTLPPLDVDNVIKPVLDGLCDAVLEDDSQVRRVISERIVRSDLGQAEAVVRTAASKYAEFLLVEVTWI